MYDPTGVAWTLCSGTHGYAMGYIMEEEHETEDNPDGSGNDPTGNWGGYERINRVYSPRGTAFTLAATDVYNPSILEVEPVKDVVCIRLNKSKQWGGPITIDGELNGASITLTLKDNVGVMEIETDTDAGGDDGIPGNKDWFYSL